MPLGGSAVATAVNDQGDITGYSSTTNGGPWHAFLYADGKMTDLGMFGGDQAIPHGINNSRQIVGV
jgi:probable HAF family extracellular repeat protein